MTIQHSAVLFLPFHLQFTLFYNFKKCGIVQWYEVTWLPFHFQFNQLTLFFWWVGPSNQKSTLVLSYLPLEICHVSNSVCFPWHFLAINFYPPIHASVHWSIFPPHWFFSSRLLGARSSYLSTAHRKKILRRICNIIRAAFLGFWRRRTTVAFNCAMQILSYTRLHHYLL